MIISVHSARQYADAIAQLLPTGAAFDWHYNSVGDALILGLAAEFSRIDAQSNDLLAFAIAQHRPVFVGSTIYHYRIYLNDFFAGSIDAGNIMVEHLMPSAKVGVRVGSRLWSASRVYYLHVRYKLSAINFADLKSAIDAFKQAHILCFYEAF